tara:strand:- start:244 stop:468 length:225 start_codon:yes stop_codon:yes gene_type:complete
MNLIGGIEVRTRANNIKDLKRLMESISQFWLNLDYQIFSYGEFVQIEIYGLGDKDILSEVQDELEYEGYDAYIF